MTENQVDILYLVFVILSFIVSFILARKVYFIKQNEVKYPVLLSLFVCGFAFITLAVIVSFIILPLYPFEDLYLERG
jgi:hypothetical protein